MSTRIPFCRPALMEAAAAAEKAEAEVEVENGAG